MYSPWFKLLGRRQFVSHTPLNFFIASAILLAAEALSLALGLHKSSWDPLPRRLHQNGTLGLPGVLHPRFEASKGVRENMKQTHLLSSEGCLPLDAAWRSDSHPARGWWRLPQQTGVEQQQNLAMLRRTLLGTIKLRIPPSAIEVGALIQM